MYQLRAVPVKEHCLKTILLECQNFYSLSDVGCKNNENVTGASICCKYSSGVKLESKPSKGLIGSEIEVNELI